jgi:excisionase family DNA binding protein
VVMTEQEVLELPVTINLLTSARALGISRSEAYILARSGRYPVPTYMVGNRYRVRRSDLLTFLRITATQTGHRPTNPGETASPASRAGEEPDVTAEAA